ncbi:MAG TPA: hypothetical protein P5155_02100, partial [Candidatus Absconditabacterales bacterium]|nr:hypothetical protein [Candidatus Absconditabacterales bacterium]
MIILDAIDTTKDNKIELQELEKALDEGFFDNEENLLQIKKNLEENAAGELVESLKTTLNSAIKEILIQEDFSINDLRIIELWNTLLGNTDEENREKITSSMEKKKLDFMYNFSFNELQNLSVQKKQEFYEKFYIISSIISGDLETVNTEKINKGNIDLFFVNSLYEEWKITKSKELEAKVTTNVEDIVKKYVLDKKQSGLIGGQYDFTAFEIYLIQLLAKMQGEEIEIDGSRARVNVQIGDKYILLPTINYNLYEKYNPKDFNEMAWKTNVWIFRQELKGLFGYIEDGEFVMSDFFEEQLKSIPDIDIQNKVLSTFGENIKEIRTHGKFYSKNQRDGLKDYFSLLVSIELETDENIKKELIKESKDKIVKIKSNVQESVTKDKGFVLNEYKSKIATTEDGEILGFVEGTTKADVEKMLTFISYDWNLKYINSNYPEFKTDLFKAIVESEFYNELKDKNSGIKEVYDNK